MRLVKSKNANINYLAKIVYIKDFHPHPDPEVSKLKCTYVDGYNIIVGIDEQPGQFIYFPTNSRINSQFLSFANLYRHGDKNANPEKTGMFEDNGRVKTIKLRGCLSEGFLMPIEGFLNWINQETQLDILPNDLTNNIEFDTVEHKGKSFWVCKKYIVRTYSKSGIKNKSNKKERGFNKVIPEFFPEHYETEQLKKVADAVKPDDLIHISHKWHGCVDANTLINTSDGVKTIKEIVDNKLNVQIEAFDTTSNQIVYVDIDDYYTIPNDGEWYEIELEDGTKLIITGNNPVWLPELNCYRNVEDLRVGDIVLKH